MPVTVQVVYPAADGTTFDHAYYLGTHVPLVDQTWGELLESQVVTKGVSGGPDTPPPFYAIATFVFADGDAMNAAMGKAAPLLEDIPNFTSTQPQMLIGERIG